MKKTLLAMVLAMAVAAAAQAVSVSLVPGAITVTPSTVFTIDVIVTDAEAPGIEVIDIQVAFNGALVEAYSVWDPEMEEYSVLPATEGQFIRKAGGPILEFLGWGDGYLSYTVTRLGPTSSTGSGTAATLTFHCLGPGAAPLSYLVQGTDLTGTIIMTGQGVVEVQQGVVPEPMTLTLIGAALTALGLVARKRS